MPTVAQEQAEAQQATVDPRFNSPRATMFTFLDAIHEVRDGGSDKWRTVTECLDFNSSGISPGTEASREVARDLWGALNHIRYVTEGDLLGRGEIGADTSFLFFPRPFIEEDETLRNQAELGDESIELKRDEDGRWRFSAHTVASAETLYEKLQPLGRKVDSDESALSTQPLVRRWMPAALKRFALLDIEAWQWLGLGLLAFLGFVVDHILRWVLRAAVGIGLRRYEGKVEAKTLAQFVRPLGLLASGLTWLALARFLGFPDGAEDILLAAAQAFTILAGTWAAWRLVDLVAEALMTRARETESRFDDVLLPMVGKTLKIVVAAFGGIYVAQSLEINVVPLITGLGIGGLAFAFAAKDTIENFFGSVAVVLDRPFEVGDWVVIGDVEGTIEELGFRSTRVRTFYNSQYTIPNSTLVRATVDNFGRRRYRRWKTTIGVQYDTRPDQLLAFAEGIRELVRTHPYTRKDYYQVWWNGFGPSSIDLLVYVFHEVPDWSTELRERERLMIDIVRLADRLGVRFAFPTQTLHMFKETHSEAEPQLETPGTSADQRAGEQGARAARLITADQPWLREKPPAVVYASSPPPLAGGEPTAPDAAETTEDTRSS